MAHRCSVCALPSDVRDHGEQMIVRGREYREVAALCSGAVSKSSWHRHMKNCYRARRFYGIGKPKSSAFERLIVVWPDGERTLGSDSFTGTFRDGDIVLRVVYQEAKIQELGNPAALCTPALVAEATREFLALFPDATIATEEVSESIVASDDISSDAAPVEAEIRGYPITSKKSEPSAPEPTATPCQHDWTNPANGIERCLACGEQKNQFQPVGWSRKQFAERNQRGPLRGFGRFG